MTSGTDRKSIKGGAKKVYILGILIVTIYVRRIKADKKPHWMDNSNEHNPRRYTAATGG